MKMKHYLSLYVDPSKNLACSAGSPVDWIAYFNQTTTSYTDHCFNLPLLDQTLITVLSAAL